MNPMNLKDRFRHLSHQKESKKVWLSITWLGKCSSVSSRASELSLWNPHQSAQQLAGSAQTSVEEWSEDTLRSGQERMSELSTVNSKKISSLQGSRGKHMVASGSTQSQRLNNNIDYLFSTFLDPIYTVCQIIQIEIHKFGTSFTWVQTICCEIQTKTWPELLSFKLKPASGAFFKWGPPNIH